MHRLLFSLSLAFLVMGCGGSDDKGGSDTGCAEACGCGCDDGCGCGDEEESDGGTYSADKATATVKGVVKWEGKAPRRPEIDMGTEKFCLENHKEPLKSERTIVGPDGGLANVCVSVKSPKGWKFPKGTGEKLLDQVGCMYSPHMTAMQVGQELKVKNSDPIMHNVHAIDMKSTRDAFNFAQSKQGQVSSQSRLKAGKYSVKCDVHGWMQSYICVFKHPFFAVTGEDGAFEIKLPPGTYTLEAWHPKWGTKTTTVTVKDGESGSANFSFSK